MVGVCVIVIVVAAAAIIEDCTLTCYLKDLSVTASGM